jgi:hypothetical protein
LEVYAEMRQQKLPAAKCEHLEHETVPASSLQKKEPPLWQDFFQSKYRIDVAWPDSFDDLTADLQHEYECEHEHFFGQTADGGATGDSQISAMPRSPLSRVVPVSSCARPQLDDTPGCR